MDTPEEALNRPSPSALLTKDGTVHSLNGAMAALLDMPAEQCVGQSFARLFPESQQEVASNLVTHGATTSAMSMHVLEFPENHGVSVVCLIAAQPIQFPAEQRALVWLHSLESGNDLGSLLIPFGLAAKSAGLSVCVYSPRDRELSWLGGSSRVAALFERASVPLLQVFRQVHPDDRRSLSQLIRSPSTESQWARLRLRDAKGNWRNLVCQSRRVRLGYVGPQRIFGVIRDDTRQESRRQEVLADLNEQRQHADEIAALASGLITASTEQELQQVVLTRVASSFGGTGALFAIVDHGRRLRVSSDAAVTPRLVDALHGLSLDAASPLSHAIRAGEPLLIHDEEDLNRLWPQGGDVPSLLRDITLLVAPLGPNGVEPIGACLMTCTKGRRPFSQRERSLINLVADLTGQALKRIGVHKARVELSIAVQRAMLPRLPDDLPGLEVAARYRPSQDGLDIGGDWYDAFVAPDGAVIVDIGDAQGHDVEASVLMGQVRTSLRAIANQEPDPANTLTRINDLLVAMVSARFASCSVLRFDPRDGWTTGASAGHVPFLLAHQDGSHDVHMLPGGPVLGVLPHASYAEGTFTLDSGTALVMVTDGLVEGPNLTLDAGLDHVGKLAAEALHDGLNAESTADRILEGQAKLGHLDDIAILVIRRM